MELTEIFKMQNSGLPWILPTTTFDITSVIDTFGVKEFPTHITLLLHILAISSSYKNVMLIYVDHVVVFA